MVAENQFLTFSSHNLGDNKFRQSTLNCKQIKNAWVEQIFSFIPKKFFWETRDIFISMEYILRSQIGRVKLHSNVLTFNWQDL